MTAIARGSLSFYVYVNSRAYTFTKCWYLVSNFRSSRPEVFCKKGVNFIKKGTLAQVFSSEFCEISKKPFLKEHLWATASEISSKNIYPDPLYNKT